MVSAGHRAISLPCGHVIHARCVLDRASRGGDRAPFVCGVSACVVQHSRRDTILASVQADPGLRARGQRMLAGINDEPTTRRPGMLYDWDQSSPGMGGAIDSVSMEDLEMRFDTVKKVKSYLAGTHARLHTHALNLMNNVLGEQRLRPGTNTPNSLLRAIKLWYLLPGILHSFDGRITRRERFKSLERGDVTNILPWLIAYTRAAATRGRGGVHEETDQDKFKRASAACRHSGGVKDAARALLAEPRSPGNEDTWNRLQSKFPHEDPAAIEEAIVEALDESSGDGVDGREPSWRPENEFNPKMLLEVISSRSANSGAGNDGQRFAHLKSIVNTEVGRDQYGTSMCSLWRRLIDNPSAFPPEFWKLWKQSSLIALGVKCRPVCIGMTWRRLIAAATVRQWRPKMEELYRDVNQFGVGVAGGVD